jgi:hypothetical protein
MNNEPDRGCQWFKARAANAEIIPVDFRPVHHLNIIRFPLGQACVGFYERLRLEDWVRSYGIAKRRTAISNSAVDRLPVD